MSERVPSRETVEVSECTREHNRLRSAPHTLAYTYTHAHTLHSMLTIQYHFGANVITRHDVLRRKLVYARAHVHHNHRLERRDVQP
jgi:hypothetical protein